MYAVVVELDPLSVAPDGRPTPLLHDPRHRHQLRTRDQVCPWFQ